MIVTVQAFVTYVNIQSSIQEIKNKDTYIQEEIEYLKKFQKTYLASEYFRKHQTHDMGLILSGEYIIKIDYIEQQEKEQKKSNRIISNKISTKAINPKELMPIDAWIYLRNSIQNKLK
jgi:hypothetical protein